MDVGDSQLVTGCLDSGFQDWNSAGIVLFAAVCRIISLLPPSVCDQWELCGNNEALWNENSESGENIARSIKKG